MDPSYTPAQVMQLMQESGQFDQLVADGVSTITRDEWYQILKTAADRYLRQLRIVQDPSQLANKSRAEITRILKEELSHSRIAAQIDERVNSMVWSPGPFVNRLNEAVKSTVDHLASQDQLRAQGQLGMMDEPTLPGPSSSAEGYDRRADRSGNSRGHAAVKNEDEPSHDGSSVSPR
jgi:hypothetical protein